MNTSADVSSDSMKKIENLAVATTAVAEQLRGEGRIDAAMSLGTARYYMNQAAEKYGIIDATEGEPND